MGPLWSRLIWIGIDPPKNTDVRRGPCWFCAFCPVAQPSATPGQYLPETF